MRTVDDLRTALDDTGTPAGIEVDAIRRRAGRQRGWTAGGAAAAVVAVSLAVALPLAARRNATVPTHPVSLPGAANCPSFYPAGLDNTGPGLDDQLVPMTVDSVVACHYNVLNLSRRPLPPRAFWWLTGSRQLPTPAARRLLATLERAAVPRPSGCVTDGESVLLQVAGAGRILRLRVDPFGCGLATNGHATRYAGSTATADLPALLSGTPPRLSCPATPDQIDWPAPATEQTDHLVPFVPERLIVCRYDPLPGRRLDPNWVHELDGTDAAKAVRLLDQLPTFSYHPCPRGADPHHEYEVVLVGQGQRAALTGSDDGCRLLGGRQRVVEGLDAARLLWPDT
jgi:hypothetical protein